jgi:nitroimidazol reductase NimA-like FMN-containing flavoprotein (pyridoxamine 5'-phosphate oxidase superfamily)
MADGMEGANWPWSMIVRELPIDECKTALSTAKFGRLACAHENQPFIVPVHFAADGDYVYLFSMPGQKIDWMRQNPRVCLELDAVSNQEEWTSIVALGTYEELLDTPEHQEDRRHALELLQVRPMWWEPSAVLPTSHADREAAPPVVYRIHVEQVTGRRGAP